MVSDKFIELSNNCKRVYYINVTQRTMSNYIMVRLVVKNFTHKECIDHNEIFNELVKNHHDISDSL